MPLDQAELNGNLPSAGAPVPPKDSVTARNEYYSEALAAGLDTLFEPRATACPMCAGKDLPREQTLRDYIQLKPGFFHMSRCENCGHIFQNPRLNARGLDFYYRDFYTGAGETTIQRHLASTTSYYRARARMIRRYHQPRRWLDVGAGYGHFSQTARTIWKETEFHVIDVSASIKQAEELGWAVRAYAGTFLDVAPQLGETFDVVSMFHYLEHTPDPLAELRAAAAIIDRGGFLMIEVPDPDSIGRRLLGRWWPSWFAPQHLHFFPSRNMESYLRQAGFDPILWHRAKAHQSTDALFSVENYLRQKAPAPRLPWPTVDSQASITRLLSIKLMWFPIRLMMMAFDLLFSPLRYIPRWPNTYRVLARKTEDRMSAK